MSSPPVQGRALEPWQREALAKVEALGRLPHGWDGGNSPAPTEGVRAWAGNILLTANLAGIERPEFAPESGGGLQITWWSGRSRELELHIDSEHSATYLKVQNGDPAGEGSFAPGDPSAQLQPLFDWLRQG